MRIDKLAMTSREALQAAIGIAGDAEAGAVEPIHLLQALLTSGERNISVIIERIGADPAQLVRACADAVERAPKVSGEGREIGLSRDLVRVLERAEKYAAKMEDNFVVTEHLLMALAEDKGDAGQVLKAAGVTRERIEEVYQELRGDDRVTSADAKPQYEALLESTVRPCNSMMTTADFDPGHTCCVIGASHDFITHNSDITVRFLAAYVESVDWLNNALKDKSSEEYAYVLDLAMERTGISNRNVIESSLESVIYTYGYDESLGDTKERPLASLEGAIADLVEDLGLKNNVLRQGFSSTNEFAQRYVNDGYLSQALDYQKSESGYSMYSVKVAVIAGDIHQIAIHLGQSLGIFESYGIELNISSAANGAGVATSLQNGEADVGFVGAPPMTTTVVNGGLIPA